MLRALSMEVMCAIRRVWCACAAGVLNFLFSRDPRYVNDGCCGPRSRSAAKAAVGIKTQRLPPDPALIGGGGPETAAGQVAVEPDPEEGGGLSVWSTLVEIQTVMSIPSFLIIIVQVCPDVSHLLRRWLGSVIHTKSCVYCVTWCFKRWLSTTRVHQAIAHKWRACPQPLRDSVRASALTQGIVGTIPSSALAFLTLYLQLLGMSDFHASVCTALFLAGQVRSANDSPPPETQVLARRGKAAFQTASKFSPIVTVHFRPKRPDSDLKGSSCAQGGATTHGVAGTAKQTWRRLRTQEFVVVDCRCRFCTWSGVAARKRCPH